MTENSPEHNLDERLRLVCLENAKQVVLEMPSYYSSPANNIAEDIIEIARVFEDYVREPQAKSTDFSIARAYSKIK